MPLQKSKSPAKQRRSSALKPGVSRIATRRSASASLLFWPVVGLTLLLWVLYRTLYDFPVWFDETLGKAIFFGLPVWFFVTMTRSMDVVDAFSFSKMKNGLLQGIAFGGIYGFAATILSLARSGAEVQTALLFSSNAFWWEFFLALMTGFWETLFFFAFVMTLIQKFNYKWSLLNQVLATSLVFIIFHLPNIALLFAGQYVLGYIFLIWAFGLGQAFIYSRHQNAYTLVISHAIWGMVLLVHMGFGS
jgi:hypothetical protein